MGSKDEFRTITYRFRLYQQHRKLFEMTKKLYGEIVTFYARQLLEHKELLQGSKLTILRQAEVLTLGEKRKGIPPQVEAPILKKVPLYFRRAAINEAISLAKRAAEQGKTQISEIMANPVFYKGMYRNFAETKVELKLYDGSRFRWVNCRFNTCGREMPKPEEMLSPTLVVEREHAFLHVPVKRKTTETKSLSERVRQGENYLALSFPLGEIFAAGAVFRMSGEELSVHLIRGGETFFKERRRLETELKRLLELGKQQDNIVGSSSYKKAETIEKNVSYEEAETKRTEKLREKLQNLIKQNAHRVANEILDYAKEHHCGVLVVPGYNGTFILNPEGSSEPSRYDWLGMRIIQYLEYKAPVHGMLLCRCFAKDVANCCSLCGASIKRYSTTGKKEQFYNGGKLYVCENGHKGNTALNTARNSGHKFQRDYVSKLTPEEMDIE